MKKFFGFLFFLIILGLVGLYFARNPLLKTAVQTGVTASTGLPLKINSIDLNFAKTYFDMQDFELHNPKNFKDPLMLTIPEVFVDYDITSIFKGIVHLNEVRLDIQQFAVIKNKDGKLNIFGLKKSAKKTDIKTSKTPPKKKSKEIEVKIDTLHVKLGKVIFKDYSAKQGLKVVELPINFNETFTDISGINSILKIILTKALTKTNIAAIANIDLGKYQQEVNDMLQQSSKKLLEQSQEKIKKRTKKILSDDLNLSEKQQKDLKDTLTNYWKKKAK